MIQSTVNPKSRLRPLLKTVLSFAEPMFNSGRLVSLDAYRGFVILMMTFVNYIEEMPGIPHVMKHAKVTEDTFTFPDLVFPGFLMMVGISIPLALSKKLEQPWKPMLMKIVGRTLTLLAVGVVYENAHRYDDSIAFLPRTLFMALFYGSVIMMWLQGKEKKAWVSWVGMATLLLLMILFRGRIEDEYTNIYLYHTWWGILGLIGWAYLMGTVVYLLSGGSGTALMGAMAFLLVLFMGDNHGRFDFLPLGIRNFIAIGAILGSTCANVLIGVVVGRIFTDRWDKSDSQPTAKRSLHFRRIKFMVLFALGMIAATWLLRPYHPISKIIATETFTLVTSGINLLAFTAFYFFMDVLKWRRGGAWLVTAGTNALFVYILPDVINTLSKLVGLGKQWEAVAWPYLEKGGNAGMINAAVMALFILMIGRLGTFAGLRMKS